MWLRAEVSRVAEDGNEVKFLNVTPNYAEIMERCYTTFTDPVSVGQVCR